MVFLGPSPGTLTGSLLQGTQRCHQPSLYSVSAAISSDLGQASFLRLLHPEGRSKPHPGLTVRTDAPKAPKCPRYPCSKHWTAGAPHELGQGARSRGGGILAISLGWPCPTHSGSPGLQLQELLVVRSPLLGQVLCSWECEERGGQKLCPCPAPNLSLLPTYTCSAAECGLCLNSFHTFKYTPDGNPQKRPTRPADVSVPTAARHRVQQWVREVLGAEPRRGAALGKPHPDHRASQLSLDWFCPCEGDVEQASDSVASPGLSSLQAQVFSLPA